MLYLLQIPTIVRGKIGVLNRCALFSYLGTGPAQTSKDDIGCDGWLVD